MSRRDKEPETVEVEPPESFIGRALYSYSLGSQSWTGDLSIDLPGAGGIPLTGPNFRVTLCRGSSVAHLDHCVY